MKIQKSIFLIVGLLTTIVLGLFFWFLHIKFTNIFITSVFNGNSLPILNDIVKEHRLQNVAVRDLNFYIQKLRPFIARVLFIVAITPLVITLLYYFRKSIKNTIKSFFNVVTHPVNLAIFRIVLFSIFLNPFEGKPILDYLQPFLEIPSELRDLPLGFGWLFNYIPVNQSLVHIAYVTLIVSCCFGIIGFLTRSAALLTLISGFYLLSIPQLFGKVTHSHPHLLWFMAILVVSNCADFLSIDSIIKSWKRADRGNIESPSPSRKYTYPLRFIWLLMGLIYFFPGLWKWLSAGLAWAFSDNLKYRLYENWHTGEWIPFFRLDHYPLIYQFAAFGGIIFEIAFIFLLFSKRFRYLAVIGGLAFHNINNILMRIPFWNVQYCYVVFVNWHYIFKRIGKFLFRQKMYLIFDGNCQLCRRTIASLKVLDVFERITYVNALNQEALANNDLLWLNSNEILKDMHVVVGKTSWKGFFAYRSLAYRILFFWPFIPWLYIPPIPQIGSYIYRQVADSRTCSIVRSNFHLSPYQSDTRSNPKSVILVGLFLLIMNSFYGITGQSYAWPFACYPKFSGILGPTRDALEIVAVDNFGNESLLTESIQKQGIPTDRYLELLKNLLQQDDKQATRLNAFWQFVSQNNPELQKIEFLKFYRLTLLTIPERQQENPVERKLILEKKLNSTVSDAK